MYILLRSLRALSSVIATKTHQELYSTSGCSWATYLFHISKYFSLHLPNFREVETPVDPENSLILLLSTSNLLPRMPSLQRGVKPFSLRWLYEHLSVANRGTNNLHEFSCQSIIRQAEDGQFSCRWVRCDLNFRMRSRLNLFGMIRLSL